jgi:hypothetical protein
MQQPVIIILTDQECVVIATKPLVVGRKVVPGAYEPPVTALVLLVVQVLLLGAQIKQHRHPGVLYRKCLFNSIVIIRFLPCIWQLIPKSCFCSACERSTTVPV